MSEVKDWDEYLELVKKYSNQYGAHDGKKKVIEPEPEPKETMWPSHVRDWSESTTSEIMAQLPNTTEVVVKDFFVKIWKEWDNTYTFNIYQVINKLHRHIKVVSDPRFKNESWAKYFVPKAPRFSAQVGATIITYLQDIQDLLILI